MMTRILIYLLISSEFAAAAAWYAVQWRTHEKRRENDLLSFLTYSLFCLSYLAYGLEGIQYNIASPIGYIADGAISVVLAIFTIRKVIFYTKNRNPKTLKKGKVYHGKYSGFYIHLGNPTHQHSIT